MFLGSEMRTTSISKRVAARSSGGSGVVSAARGGEAHKSQPRVKFGTILVPVDFSAPSRAAFAYALQLAEHFDAQVRLLHVVEDTTSPDFKSFPLTLSNAAVVASAKHKLVEFAQTGSHPVTPVFPEVRTGDPWEEIISAATKWNADLIIIPTHGRSGLKHILMGSVAEKVIRNAPCPVLVLRNEQVEQFGAMPAARNKSEVIA